MRVWLTGDTEKIKEKKKERRKGREGKQFPNSREFIRSTVAGWIRSSIRSTCFLPNDTHQTRRKLDLASRWTRGPVLRGPLLAFLSHLSFRPFRERQPFYYIPCRCERPATPERVHSIKRRRFDRFISDTNRRASFCFSLMLPLHSRRH